MATLEQEHGIPGPRPRPPVERHVFAAVGRRRAWLLRLAGLGTAALALVWLAALGVAMLGAGRLPGIPLAGGKQVRRVPDATTKKGSPFAPPRAGRPTAQLAPAPSRSEAQTSSTLARVRHAAPAPTAPPAAADPLPSAPAPAREPSLSQQGWARRGWTAPPGQAKRDEPVPRGRSAHTDTSATANTTAITTQGSSHGVKKG